MRYTIFTLCLALFFGILAHPVQASEFQDMDICLGRQIVARILCKPTNEVNYVSKVRDNIYLFSAFYAKKETHFFVGVYKSMIRVQGKEFQTVTRSIPYHFDATAKCGVVDYSTANCLSTERIVCCSQKTVEEELDDKFWDRPIPDLLEEDLRKATQNSNSTKPSAPDDKKTQQ
jgi:hypothetical protein